MSFKIVRNDITKMKVDVIVNTANPKPIYATGTDTAVYLAAGADKLLKERQKIGEMEEGEVAITPGFLLPAKYIIHAVSPNFHHQPKEEQIEKLRRCYARSLELAQKYHCKSIAFPLISTGNLGCPKEEGIRIAIDEINAFLLHHPIDVYLVVFDEESTKLSASLYPALEAYIDNHYVSKQGKVEYGQKYREKLFGKMPQIFFRGNKISPPAASKGSKTSYEESISIGHSDDLEEDSDFYYEHQSTLKDRMTHLSDTFQEYLMYLIEQKKLKNADVYKRAIITKQTFSKIKLNPDYHPDKATAMRLCIGAKLNLDETKDLLARAGYALSPCDKRDIIFTFFIEHHVFDMIEIDIALEEHGLPCFIK